MLEEIDRTLDAWAQRGAAAFRPNRELSDLMARILGRYLFGFDFSQGPSLHRSLIALSGDSVLRHVFSRPVAIAVNGRAVARAHRVLDEVCGRVLDEGAPTVFLEALRRGVSDGDLDRRTALDEVRNFLVAGHETSATALSWVVALLAQSPATQEALRTEARAVALDGGTDSHTERLELATAVAREAMRLYPPVPMSVARTVRAVDLGGYRLPRGAHVDVCSYVVHRDPGRWPDPERFDPSRFAAGTPPMERYLPFLGGPHLCLGRGLALLELRAAIARITERFELDAPEGMPAVDLRLSLHPKGLVLRAREVR